MEGLSYQEEANLQYDGKAYLKRYMDPHEPLGYQLGFLKCWHSFYQEHGKEFDSSKATMLEFGEVPRCGLLSV